MPAKKIMVFTIPNDGHLNILKRMIRQHQAAYDFQLVLVDRRNTPPDLSDVTHRVVTLERSRQFLNTPASQVFQRVDALLDDCVRVARSFDPDLIIYDFCALEGHFVARILGIPSWCSIPGLMGPFTHCAYLAANLSSAVNQRAIQSIQQRFSLDICQPGLEIISNCLHIPAEVNLLWSYPAVTPADFRHNREDATYRFAGYLSDGYRRAEGPVGPPTVYLSFGTEVMDNLWLTQEATRVGVRTCVAALAQRWKSDPIQVVFATQGKTVLDHYPPNWAVHDKVDQQEVLSRADVFVTHGGSNSFHEAILLQVPMVVVPFFGDQILVAQRADDLGIGIGVVTDDSIDKEKSKRLLNADLVDRIDEAVIQVLATDKYRRSFDALPLEATAPLSGLVEETVAEAPAATVPGQDLPGHDLGPDWEAALSAPSSHTGVDPTGRTAAATTDRGPR
ncbi:glycosyltransferase [Micromonospora deserti]|nr:glycosyltransferase [Micromonospora deserti]